MTTVNNLFAVAVRVGLLDTNPFTHLKIKTPKGTGIPATDRSTRRS